MRKVYLILVLILGLNGCLEDKAHLIDLNLRNESILLKNIEAISGDYINNNLMPSKISAIELNDSLDNYKIYDIRKTVDYEEGHIPNAINISNQELWDEVEKNYSGYSKIIIVSYTGQAASYYTTLLRYAGFNNVYILEFGMCYWNSEYIKYWPSADQFIKFEHSTNYTYAKDTDNFYQLPANDIVENEEIIERIKELIKLDFNDQKMVGENSKGYYTDLNTDFKNIEDNSYIMFYGSFATLTVTNEPQVQEDNYPGTIFYIDYNIKSTEYLMTIPNNQPVYIYSLTGTESACLVAYLRLLGYNAINVNFGINSYRYYRAVGNFYDWLVQDFEVVSE